MSLTLYLVRHGETTYSRTGGYCGALDADLTDNGLKMAAALGAAHHSIAWTAAYVSPMKRTIATAKPLCDAAGLEMQLRDGLKEIRYGAWEGLTQEYVQEHYADDYRRWLAEPAWNAPTNGETSVQIANRALLVVAEITQKHTSGNVLIVSHKATIRIILCSLLGIDLGRYRYRISTLAGSISTVKFNEHGPMLEVLGDRSYMSEELLALEGT